MSSGAELALPLSVVERLRAAASFCQSIESLKITTADQAVKANDLANKLLEFKKTLKADYDLASAPLLSKLEEIRAKFKPVQAAIEGGQKKVKLAVYDFKVEEDAKQAERQVELDRAAETDLTVPEQAPSGVPYLPGRGAVVRDNWKFVVDDVQAFIKHCVENKLYQFLSVDQSACNQYAKKNKKREEFPGAKITVEKV